MKQLPLQGKDLMSLNELLARKPKNNYSDLNPKYSNCSLEDRLINFCSQFINIYVIVNHLDFERTGAHRSSIFKSA